MQIYQFYIYIVFLNMKMHKTAYFCCLKDLIYPAAYQMSTELGPIMQFQNLLRRHPEKHAMFFDPIRNKWFKETPEELVRQCLILFLKHSFSIPLSRIAVEKQIKINNLNKRFDLVIYAKTGNPYILIECKSNHIQINQAMFDQASNYNLNLKAPYLGISNGLEFIVCKMDFLNWKYEFIKKLPDYPF